MTDYLCVSCEFDDDPCLCRMESDPARSNVSLRSKLDENRRIGTSRLDEVSDFTAIKAMCNSERMQHTSHSPCYKSFQWTTSEQWWLSAG